MEEARNVESLDVIVVVAWMDFVYFIDWLSVLRKCIDLVMLAREKYSTLTVVLLRYSSLAS